MGTRRGGSNEYPQSMFEQKYEKYQSFLPENFHFLEVKFSLYLNKSVFVMCLGTVTVSSQPLSRTLAVFCGTLVGHFV